MGDWREAYSFWWGNLKEKAHMEDGRIILKLIFKQWDGGTDRNDLVQDSDR